MELIDQLLRMTGQRPLAEVAGECDMVFTDDLNKWPGELTDDPFKQALNHSRKRNIVCLAIFERYYVKIKPDPTWMRALRLYQELQNSGESSLRSIRK